MSDKKPRKFFVDSTVLRLGKWLRYLGFDVSIVRSEEVGSDGVLLTKKRRIEGKSRNRVFVPFDRIGEQLAWFKKNFGADIDLQKVGSRCIRCNKLLVGIPKEAVRDKVPDYIFQTHTAFRVCPDCGRIYWKGSHAERMWTYLEKIGFFVRDGS